MRTTYHLRGKEHQRLPGKVIHKLVSKDRHRQVERTRMEEETRMEEGPGWSPVQRSFQGGTLADP